MVQVNGICRLETHRFSSDLDARVKYSTSCPSRRDAPSDAKRAIPISLGLSEGASKGREVIEYSPFVRLQYAFPGKLVKRGKSGRNGRSWEKWTRWGGAHWGTCFGSWRIVSRRNCSRGLGW